MQRFIDFKNRLVRILYTNPIKTVFIIASIIIFSYYILNHHKPTPTHVDIKINDAVIYSQIADTENERSLGLSFTKQLDENAGMTFIFPTTSVKNFWMRDMNYNIDIIWIDENKAVVGFHENADKDSYDYKYPENSRIYRSPVNTKYVLEVTAGTVQKLKIKTGDVLDFNY